LKTGVPTDPKEARLERRSTPSDNLEVKKELEFIPASPEQIRNSMELIGYRTKLDKAFKAAIKRAKKTTQ